MIWSISSLPVTFVKVLMCLYFIQDPFRPFHSQHGSWSHGWQDGWDWSRAAGISPSRLDHLQELVQTWGRLCHTGTLCYGGSSGLLGYSTCWSLVCAWIPLMFGDLWIVYEGFMFVLGTLLAFLEVMEVEKCWPEGRAASSDGLSSDMPDRNRETCSHQWLLLVICQKAHTRKEKSKVRPQVSKKEWFCLFFPSFNVMKSTVAGLNLLLCLDRALSEQGTNFIILARI